LKNGSNSAYSLGERTKSLTALDKWYFFGIVRQREKE